MAKKKATTYTLRVTFGMSHATVQRLQSNLPVTTHTLDKLCKSLDCRLEDIAEYVPDAQKITKKAPGNCQPAFLQGGAFFFALE